MRVDNRWIGWAVTAAVLLLCLCVLQGCRSRDTGGGNVATVDGDPISFAEFWEEFRNRYDDVADPSTLRSEVLLQMKAEVLRDLVRRRILLQEARRRGISVSGEALSARMDRIRSGYSGRMFQRILLEHRQDPDQFRRAVSEQLILEALYRQVTSGAGDVTEEEIGGYYDARLGEFLVPETVRMRQMVVRDRYVAMELLRRLRRGVQEFSALAAEHSLLPEIESPGRLEAYRMGELPETLEELAFSAEVGRIAGPVETPYGFHLILVEERVPAHLPSLAEVGEEIRARLLEERREDAYARWVEGKIRESVIRVHPSLRDAMVGP